MKIGTITLEPIGEDKGPGLTRYRALFENGVYMGDITRDSDLTYNFWPELRGGFWDESILTSLLEVLSTLNKPIWEDYLEYCRKNDKGNSNESIDESFN